MKFVTTPVMDITYYPPTATGFTMGWVSAKLGTPCAHTQYDLYCTLHPSEGDIQTYRQSLMDLEESMAEGIETVRLALEALPAQSVESAPASPLFNAFPEEDAQAS